MDSDSWVEAEVNFFRREKHFPRDYLDYLKNRAKSGDMENLNSLLKFWVWGRKIDPATGVTETNKRTKNHDTPRDLNLAET